MSVVVPAIPHHLSLLDDPQALYQFLLAHQEQLAVNQTKLFSFSQRIEPIDPLQALAHLGAQETVHFYAENPSQSEVSLSYGIAQSQEILTNDRFSQAHHFIESCFQTIIRVPGKEGFSLAPTIFSGFNFFPEFQAQAPFPPAFLVLPQFQIQKNQQGCFLTCNISLENSTNLIDLVKDIIEQLKIISSLSRSGARLNLPTPTDARLCSRLLISPSVLHASICSTLSAIEARQLSKVVLAQALDLETIEPFYVHRCLQNLQRSYGHCHLYSLGNGRGQCFVGASPERLLSIRNQHLITDALAGSAPRGQSLHQDQQLAAQLLNNPKEQREHQAVIEFILHTLTQLGLSPRRSPLRLLKLSNIQHLWTPIQSPMPAGLHPLDLIAKLHPTPAVAGVPTAQACDTIRRYETFDRSLYGAPLGWIDADGNSEFIVGIRSALLSQYQARLFAGAGIVAGSDPKKELAEIELKLQALWRALTNT